MMADWGESTGANEKRQEWLRTIVEETQYFLRNTAESSVRGQLTELYRLASAALTEHPRGYAERVGDRESSPMILGTVTVASHSLKRHEPPIELRVNQPYLLAPVPRDSELETWTFGFASDPGEVR